MMIGEIFLETPGWVKAVMQKEPYNPTLFISSLRRLRSLTRHMRYCKKEGSNICLHFNSTNGCGCFARLHYLEPLTSKQDRVEAKKRVKSFEFGGRPNGFHKSEAESENIFLY